MSLASAALAFQTHYTPASPPRPACSSGAGVAAPHAMSPRVWRAVYGRRGACVALSICHAHTEEVRETGAAATDSAAASHALRRGLLHSMRRMRLFPSSCDALGARGVSAKREQPVCAMWRVAMGMWAPASICCACEEGDARDGAVRARRAPPRARNRRSARSRPRAAR